MATLVKDTTLSAYVDLCVTEVLVAGNGGQGLSLNDVLGDDLGYTSDSILTLIRTVQDRLNATPPGGLGPFWLPRTPKQRLLVNATVGGFEDWVYHQCEASAAALS